MKSPITKKIESFRKKIERGIKWAEANGICVQAGAWYEDEGAMCPIGCRVEKDNGPGAAKALNEKYQENDDRAFRQVARKFGIAPKEVKAFIAGVDSHPNDRDWDVKFYQKPNELAFFKLGTRLSDKYAL
jgi:hypothetical protein